MSTSPTPSLRKDDLTKVDEQPISYNADRRMSQESLSAHEVVRQKIQEEREKEKASGVTREVDEGDVIAEGEET